MREYEAPVIDFAPLTECDVISTSLGGDTPLEDEEW